MFPLSALSMVLTMPLVGRMFDRFRTRFGFAAGLLVVAAALGPLPVGLAFDRLGGPTLTLSLITLYPIGCAVLAALQLRTPAGVSHPKHLE